jgi:hypothetical protein
MPRALRQIILTLAGQEQEFQRVSLACIQTGGQSLDVIATVLSPMLLREEIYNRCVRVE